MSNAASATAGAGSAAASEAVFAELHRDPVVQALLQACGATQCHLGGRGPRDPPPRRPTHDLDAVVAGRGDEIAGELAARLPARLVRLGGEDFAAYRLGVRAPARRT